MSVRFVWFNMSSLSIYFVWRLEHHKHKFVWIFVWSHRLFSRCVMLARLWQLSIGYVAKRRRDRQIGRILSRMQSEITIKTIPLACHIPACTRTFIVCNTKSTHTHARTRCASVFHQITASMPFKYHVCVCVCAACTVTTINSPRSNTRNNTQKNLQQVCVSFLIELLC